MSGGGRREDWLCERQTEGVELCLKVKRWLVRRRTPYQELELAETEDLGLVLALDGKFMLSERDEPFYHEMLVHPAMLLHPRPERVLIVGGGDGGTLREVLRHPQVKRAYLVEIDAEVIEVAREFLPSVHRGSFDDPRAQVVIQPGEEFIAGHPREFDVIVVDSTDPIGPGEALFSRGFFAACREALQEGGLFVTQSGSPFYFESELAAVYRRLTDTFKYVRIYLGQVPVYPSGTWAYAIASQREPSAAESHLEREFESRGLKTSYYSPAVHRAAFSLPGYVGQLLSTSRGKA
jgi:spermidine synthase